MKQPMFIELGMGADLQGQDPTKAAIKAIKNAISTNYLPAMRQLVDQGNKMRVQVKLGVPEAAGPVDVEAVKAALPHGTATIEVAPGGLMAPSHTEGTGDIVMVVAAVTVGI